MNSIFVTQSAKVEISDFEGIEKCVKWTHRSPEGDNLEGFLAIHFTGNIFRISSFY
jgi:hypothetical protein